MYSRYLSAVRCTKLWVGQTWKNIDGMRHDPEFVDLPMALRIFEIGSRLFLWGFSHNFESQWSKSKVIGRLFFLTQKPSQQNFTWLVKQVHSTSISISFHQIEISRRSFKLRRRPGQLCKMDSPPENRYPRNCYKLHVTQKMNWMGTPMSKMSRCTRINMIMIRIWHVIYIYS